MDGACLPIIGAIDQALEPGMNQSAGAHRARLNCNKQLAALQPMVTESCTGLAQGDDLGVGGGIGIGKVAVPSSPYNMSVVYHDRAHRDFSRLQRALRAAQGFLHP